MDSIKENLRRLGLTKSEVRAYLYLLEVGAASPPAIAVGTGIARSNCYHVLAGLKAKSLITERQRGKRIQYAPKDPHALLLSIESKKSVVEDLLPDLQALYGAKSNKPRVHFYEGFDEVKAIYERSLETEFIKAFGSTKQLAALDSIFFTHYFKELKQRGIILRDIVTYESGAEPLSQAQEILGALYEPVLLPKKYENLLTDMLLWDDTVALITLKEPIIGTVLVDKELARTFNAIHDSLYEQIRHG